jgi:hypothetical protein
MGPHKGVDVMGCSSKSSAVQLSSRRSAIDRSQSCHHSHLVGASGELELVGGLEVGVAGAPVGGCVIAEVEEELEHLFCL